MPFFAVTLEHTTERTIVAQRIDLPSGAWLDVRDEFRGSDRKKVRRAIRLSVTPDGVQEMFGDVDDVMRDAMLTEITTDWSLAAQGIPIPSVPGPDGRPRTDVIAESLSSEDYGALQEAAQPLLEKVLGRSRPNSQSGNGRSPS